MRLYNCIVHDGKDCYNIIAAAKDKKELLDVYGSNGTFEKITDVTREYNTISVSMLEDTLRRANYGKGEIALIIALLEEHNKQF